VVHDDLLLACLVQSVAGIFSFSVQCNSLTQTHTHTHTETDRQTDTLTHRQTQTHTETDRQTDRQTDTHAHTERHIHRQKIASDYEKAIHAGIPCPVLIIAGHFACMPCTCLKSVSSIQLRDDNTQLVGQALP